MPNEIRDEDVRLLAGIAGAIQKDFVSPDEGPWTGSPFAWILTLQSSPRGRLGKQLVAEWCRAKGLAVGRSGDSEADITVGKERVEVKFSTLWKGGFYKFQQIRDQDYSLLICLGIAPTEARMWVIPKRLISRHFNGTEVLKGIGGQHRGKAARDTQWLTVYPSKPQEWLAPYGGRLAQAYEALIRIIRS